MAISSKSLRSGRDYPSSWDQFIDWFHDEESCIRYLERLRWPEGFICPKCHLKEEPYRLTRHRLLCRGCRYQSTVTAGTLFSKTRIPLSQWFAAAWYITSQKHGMSALGLQKILGLGSYQTAWSMLHKFRRAMVIPGRDQLSGLVEVDETFVGGRDSGKIRPPQPDSRKSIGVVAVELLEPKGFGRIRLHRISDTSKVSLRDFVLEAIEPGSTVRTDGSPGYGFLTDEGYSRDKRVQLGTTEPAHITLPGVHRIAALLKRWLLGTHQGSVLPEHLDYYLDEYTFRFNRRKSRSRGLLFYRLLGQSVVTEPVTYREIVKHNI